jgi:parallel beta-helix repeat protein
MKEMTGLKFGTGLVIILGVSIVVSLAFFSAIQIPRSGAPFSWTSSENDLEPSASLISINGDSQIATYASSGDGSAGSPYIIQDRSISENSSDAIDIQNVNVYLDILKCSVSTGNSSYDGIDLYNCMHVDVINCSIYSCNIGLYLSGSCTDDTISGNNCANNVHAGIWIWLLSASADNNTISGNNCPNNYDGIMLGSGSNNTIVGNNCPNNIYGICLQEASNTSVFGNNCPSNYNGIYLYSASNNTISGNNCTSNGDFGIWLQEASIISVVGNNCPNNLYGIYLDDANNTTVVDNNCSDNGGDGILLYDASNITVVGNNCQNNGDGIYLYGESKDNLIWGNNFFANTGYQACSDSPANQWYYDQTGNYYGDYLAQNPSATNDGRVWNIPYQINGAGANQDPYPLVNKANHGFASAPQDLVATAGNEQVMLNWAVPASNGGSPITNYRIYQGTVSGGEVLLVTIRNTTTYTSTNLTNGQVYYFEVQVVNAAGNGTISAEASAIPSASLQSNVAINDFSFLTGNGTYVGGQIFTVRVSFSNTGNLSATGVSAALSYGGFSYLSSNSSASITVPSSGTGHVDFLVTVALGTATQNPVVISATWTGTEQMTNRSLSGGPSTVNVGIRGQAVLAITSIACTTGNGTYVAGQTFTVTTTIQNSAAAGGAKAVNVVVTLSFDGYAYLSAPPSSLISIAAGSSQPISIEVTISVFAVSQNPVTISATASGSEEISGRALSAGPSTVNVAIMGQATLAISSVTLTTGNGTYIGGQTFSVQTVVQNTAAAGAAGAANVVVTLTFGGYGGLSASASSPVFIAAGSSANIDIVVTVLAGATTSAVTISATTSGSEEWSGRALSAGPSALGAAIKAQASLAISSITCTTGNGTYVAGMTFGFSVAVQNTAPSGSARALGVTVALTYGGYTYLSANASASQTVDAGSTVNFNFLVTVAPGVTTSVVTVMATAMGNMEISNAVLTPATNMTGVSIRATAVLAITSVTIHPTNGNETYIAGESFTAYVVVANTAATGSAKAVNVVAVLTFGGYAGLSAMASTPISIAAGSSLNISILVTVVDNAATNNAVTITATATGNEEISNTPLTAATNTLSVSIKNQETLPITGIIYMTGNGTYIGGTAFTIRITIKDNGTNGANAVTVTPSFGPYSWISSNASNVISITAGGTGTIDFLVTVGATATTTNPLTITAACSGTDAITSNPVNGFSGSNYLNVVILSQAQIVISSVTTNATLSKATPNVWLTATVVVRNTGGTPVNLGSVALTLNSSWAQNPTPVNQSTGLYVPANGRIGVQIQFFLSASTPNNTHIQIGATFSGTEAISGRPIAQVTSGTSISVVLAPFNVVASIVGGRQVFVGDSDTFVVEVLLDNSQGTTNVNNGSLSLSFAGYNGFTVNTTYMDLLINKRMAVSEYFSVIVTGSASLGLVSFNAVFNGNNPSNFTKDSAAVTFTTLNQANVTITGITFQTGNGTYVAGMSFVLRVAFTNSGTSAASGNVSAVLGIGDYWWLTSNSSGWLTVPAGTTVYQYFNVTIAANAISSVVTISATWNGTEEYSNRLMSSSGPYTLITTILARASISITNMTYSAPQGLYNGGSFTVDVYFNNTGGTDVTDVFASLVSPTWLIYSSPVPKTIYAGSSGYFEFTVVVSCANVTGSIGATFTGHEAISGNLLSGSSGSHNQTITIPAPASILITNIAIVSIIKNYTAGDSFLLNVTLTNTGGLDANVTVTLNSGAYILVYVTPTITVPAYESTIVSINVKIPTSGQTASLNVTVSYTAIEQFSLRQFSGTSEPGIQVELNIVAAGGKSSGGINITIIVIFVFGMLAVVAVGGYFVQKRVIIPRRATRNKNKEPIHTFGDIPLKDILSGNNPSWAATSPSRSIEKRRRLSKIWAPPGVPEQTPAKFVEVLAANIAGKKLLGLPEPEVPRASPEELQKAEAEMRIDASAGQCLVCKQELIGDIFICPSCKTARYHRACADALANINETCWVCKQPFPSTRRAAREDEDMAQSIPLEAPSLTVLEPDVIDRINQLSLDPEQVEMLLTVLANKEPSARPKYIDDIFSDQLETENDP